MSCLCGEGCNESSQNNQKPFSALAEVIGHLPFSFLNYLFTGETCVEGCHCGQPRGPREPISVNWDPRLGPYRSQPVCLHVAGDERCGRLGKCYASLTAGEGRVRKRGRLERRHIPHF